MTRYFAQNTPRAGLEHMMMSVPGFQKRGGGMMILSRFCYKPEDVDCRYCLHYRRRSCQVRTCPYIAERLKSGAIEYLDLILEYFGHIPHAGLHKRIQAVEHWSGPDQAVLHTVSVHLRSRFADRVWDDAPPGYLAALYLLASKERLWQPALPALSHDSIDFSRIVSKPHGFAIQDYDIENLKGTVYTGEVTTDRYGRKIPKHAHGTVNLDGYTSSGEELLKAATSLYDRIVDKTLLARRLTLCANHLLDESSVPEDLPEQIDLFTDYSAKEKQKKEADTAHARERKLQETMLDIKKRFGKNAILKGLNLEDGATARERNNQIGGHKA